ncbi:cytochrome P450 [Musa troglodytarum]|uniref:Cytochrome P450 n=1 Tax=Musa troglodytarum TaxID=320322 RepID=A0A9E7JP44_9LILI|nr:cytochrome P450 [Musa troglodytarum]
MTFRSPGQVGGVITANASNVEHMLKSNFENYPKGERSFRMLVDFLGHGIFNSDGEEWKCQRKQASYEFSKRSLRNFMVDTVQSEIAHRLLPLLRRAGEKGETMDLQSVLERFAFDSICKVVFDEDPACLAEDTVGDATSSNFMRAFEEAQNLIVGRFMDAFEITWRVKKLLDIGSERRLRELLAVVHGYAMQIIRGRKEKAPELNEHHDLLSRFASNKNKSEEFLRDIVTNYLVAGRESTSSALTWFFWILSTRPDAAVTESMRLYPPVPMDTQSCLEDDTMPDGTFVGKGWFVTYSAYAMGRLEDIWGRDCNEYKPERWLENGVFNPGVPCRPKDVSGEGDGVCTDEVHRSLRGGKVRDRRGGEGEDTGARAVPHPEDERRPAN